MKLKIHYAWIVLIVTFLGLLAVQGIRLSFGAFILPWQNEFSADRGSISLISSISFIVYGASLPVFGKLVDRFGVRNVFAASALITGMSMVAACFAASTWQLAIIYGLIASVGFGGASGVVASVAITNWFAEKRGFALGILEAGFGAGQMIVVPASLFLIQFFGWKSTVVYMGILLVAIIFPILVLFLRSKPEDKGIAAYGGKEADHSGNSDISRAAPLNMMQIMRMREFWFLMIPYFICGFTTTGLMDTHLIPFCQGMGFSDQITGIAVSLLAAFNIVGCLLSGKLADRFSCTKMLGILYGVRALAMIILILTFHPSWLLFFSILFGLVDFATVAPTTLVATSYFERYSVGLMLGYLTLSHQVGSALGSYVPGLIFSFTGSYLIPFYCAVVLLVAASILNFLLPEYRRINQA
jgi:MFS family permease